MSHLAADWLWRVESARLPITLQITAHWHLTMPLAGGIEQDIVESLSDSSSRVKASRNPCVNLQSGPVRVFPCRARAVACVSLAPFGRAETSCP